MNEFFLLVGQFTVMSLAVAFVGLCFAGLAGWGRARRAEAREKETYERWQETRELRDQMRDEITTLQSENEALKRGSPYRGPAPTGGAT